MPTTRLLLIRHGETDDNHNEVFQGQGGRGLNARGREQAGLLATRLSRSGVRVAALYASDLERARETAAIVGSALGLEPILEPGLREVYLGGWQGLSRAEVATRFPDEWSAWQRGVDLKRGGGESYAELGARVGAAIERIASAHPGGTVALVSHGASLKVFVAGVLGVGTLGMTSFRGAGNTAVSVVERDPGGEHRLVLWSDEAHLGDPLDRALCG